MIRAAIIKAPQDILKAVNTTAFKVSFFFALLFSIATGASMYTIYKTAENEIQGQIDSRLLVESMRLQRRFEDHTTLGLYAPVSLGIVERSPSEPNISYCITQQEKLTDTATGEKESHPVILNSNIVDLCHTTPTIDEERSLRDPIMRVVIKPVAGGHFRLISAYDTSEASKMLRRMYNTTLTVTIILLLASFFGSFYISHHIVRIIGRISRTARRIVDGDFAERIETTANDSDEMNQLATNLNHMLDRIESLIISQRQVTNNIAHDLRSPLNRLRNRMEVALLDRHNNADNLRDVIEESIKDAENLLKTFNALLSIAQVESRAKDDFLHTDVSAICADLAEFYDVLPEDGEHTFRADIAPNLFIQGNRQLIAQAITNLLDNAVKYTPNGGDIRLQAFASAGKIHVIVADNGAGIPPDKRKEVLKRFVRLDSARSSPGNGLGLSLVSAIVNLHNGEIILGDNQPGLKIEIVLPVDANESTPPAGE